MMSSTIQVLVVLLAVVAAVAVIANRLKVPPSILLVLTGVVIALIPGLPTVELAPELVLLLILPPVIYNSAFLMSWREFQFNLRPITLLAVGGVVFTTLAVAAAASRLGGAVADRRHDELVCPRAPSLLVQELDGLRQLARIDSLAARERRRLRRLLPLRFER